MTTLMIMPRKQSDKSSSEEGFDRSGPSNMDPPRKIRPADKAQTDTDATSEFGDIDVDTEPETGFKQTVFRKGKRAHEEMDGGKLNAQDAVSFHFWYFLLRQLFRHRSLLTLSEESEALFLVMFHENGEVFHNEQMLQECKRIFEQLCPIPDKNISFVPPLNLTFFVINLELRYIPTYNQIFI
ncbi:hypothetical protein RF11_08412 [Thelohanellus kitauei]|uniref:Uncharacterized protein n=1 Tax=Thelohanellus kitauei TaxID=669202 RepID=A0A0C2J7A9_THEKT|nr:hypothetical protein RF11_08412 [Thelohanellus kitauei]